MNVALREPVMSLEEFLAWDNRQEGRWEFDGYRATSDGRRYRGSQPDQRVEFALRQRLKSPRRVYRETCACGWRTPSVTRSDGRMYTGGEHRHRDKRPCRVIEVLSASTSRTDRIAKNREYEATPSIRRYILLEQDAIAAEVYAREGDRWVRSTVIGDGVLAMPEVDVEIPLADAYAGLELGTKPADFAMQPD